MFHYGAFCSHSWQMGMGGETWLRLPWWSMHWANGWMRVKYPNAFLCQNSIATLIPSCFGHLSPSYTSNSVTNSEHSVILQNLTYGLYAGDLHPCDELRKTPILGLTDCLSHTKTFPYELMFHWNITKTLLHFFTGFTVNVGLHRAPSHSLIQFLLIAIPEESF